MKVEFSGKLEKHEPAGAFITLSAAASKKFPGRRRVRVVGTVGGVEVKSILMPAGEGERVLGVHKATIAEGGFSFGDVLSVSIEEDKEPRPEIVVPADLAKALGKDRAAFDALSYTCRKEHVLAIEEAKKPETRAKRIAKAVEMVSKKAVEKKATAKKKTVKKTATKKKKI